MPLNGMVRVPLWIWRAALKQTAMLALLPNPAPIGIVDRKV